MVQPRIMLGGGGDEHDEAQTLETFAGWLGKGRLLYLPTALMYPSNQEDGFRWARQALAPYGVTDIDAWLDLDQKTAGELEAYDGVFIGGGNTYYLLQQVRLHGLDKALVEFVLSGKPVYGGSAGAIILGADITSCAHIDHNIVGLKNLRGLDLALGHTIWCHFTPGDAQRVEEYTRRTGVPSITLTERGGAYREGEGIFAAGGEPASRFSTRGWEFFSPGERII